MNSKNLILGKVVIPPKLEYHGKGFVRVLYIRVPWCDAGGRVSALCSQPAPGMASGGAAARGGGEVEGLMIEGWSPRFRFLAARAQDERCSGRIADPTEANARSPPGQMACFSSPVPRWLLGPRTDVLLTLLLVYNDVTVQYYPVQ